MSSISIKALGGLRVQSDGRDVAGLPSQPTRCALLLYLVVERSATRDQLTALLWPERVAERARHSLSQALYSLRQELGDGWIDIRGERIETTADAKVDALDFIAAAEAARYE